MPDLEIEEGVEFLDDPPIGEKQKGVLRVDKKNPNLHVCELRAVSDESDVSIVTKELIGEQMVLMR